MGAGQSSTLNLRIPIWTSNAKASINAQSLTVPAPGNFLSVTRKLTLQLPINLRTDDIRGQIGQCLKLNRPRTGHPIQTAIRLQRGKKNGEKFIAFGVIELVGFGFGSH